MKMIKPRPVPGRFYEGKKPGYAFSEHEAALEPLSGGHGADEGEARFQAGEVPKPLMLADYRVRFMRARRFLPGFMADVEKADGTKIALDVRIGKFVETAVKDPESGDLLNLKLIASSPAIRLTIYLNDAKVTREAVVEAMAGMMGPSGEDKVWASYLLGKAVRERLGALAAETGDERLPHDVAGRDIAGRRLLALAFASGLSDPDQRVRTNSAWGLYGLALAGSQLGAAVPALVSGLGDSSAGVRLNSTLALMAHYADAKDVDGMEHLLNHPRRDVRRAAASALPVRIC